MIWQSGKIVFSTRKRSCLWEHPGVQHRQNNSQLLNSNTHQTAAAAHCAKNCAQQTLQWSRSVEGGVKFKGRHSESATDFDTVQIVNQHFYPTTVGLHT